MSDDRARDDLKEGWKNPALAAIRTKMLLYAGGTAATLVSAMLLLALARSAAERAEGGRARPRVGGSLGVLAAVLCVLAPLVGLWLLLGHVRAEHPLWPEGRREAEKTPGTTPTSQMPELLVGALSAPVQSSEKRDVRFPQLDSQGLPTNALHYFRQRKPDKAEGFTVKSADERHGTIRRCCLEDLGTGEVYEFADVPVEKIGDGWIIRDEGWTKIRDELEAKMGVRLGMPLPQ
jgi:hypothetical protein